MEIPTSQLPLEHSSEEKLFESLFKVFETETKSTRREIEKFLEASLNFWSNQIY